MDVAETPVVIIVGHVEGRWAARGSDVATRGGGSALASRDVFGRERGLFIEGTTPQAPTKPGSSRLGIEPKTPVWLVQDQPPAHRGI